MGTVSRRCIGPVGCGEAECVVGLLDRLRGVAVEGDPADGVVGGAVVAHLEVQGVEQRADWPFGQAGKGEVPERQLVDELDILRRLLDCELFEGGEFGLPFGFEVAEAVADACEQCAVRVVVRFEGADEPVLLVDELIDAALQRSMPRGLVSLLLCLVLAKISGEELPSLRPEDTVGEESVETSDQSVFADPDAGGVIGIELPGHAAEVQTGLAGVVSGVAAGLAEHPSSAHLTDDVRAQQVAALGVRMLVRRGAVAGAATPSRDAAGRVEQLAGDQRLMSRLW